MIYFTEAPEVIPGDPSDDPIVQTALLGRADFICTLDNHFNEAAIQAYCSERGIAVLGDVTLLRLLRQTPPG